MEYNINTVDEYLDAVKNDPKYPKFMELRQYILGTYGELVESIENGVLRYGSDENAVFYIQVQRQHLGLYVGDIKKIEKDEPILHGVSCGKGCIRLRKTTDLKKTGVKSFIDKTIQLWKSGMKMGC